MQEGGARTRTHTRTDAARGGTVPGRPPHTAWEVAAAAAATTTTTTTVAAAAVAAAAATGETAKTGEQAGSRVIRLGAGGDVWRSSAGRDAGCYVGCLRYDDLYLPTGDSGLDYYFLGKMGYYLGKIDLGHCVNMNSTTP